MQFTPEQQLAIERDGNVIVSAAAGAGKTAVLTERLASRVASGTPVERLLVMTFTRAAAAEMKARLEKRLNALALETGDPALKKRLRQEAENVGRASISTNDAFCARVVRRHGHRIGVAPTARIADEMELCALSDRVKDALLTELAAEQHPAHAALHGLLAAMGSEDAAWQAVTRVYDFMQTQPDPDAWLTRAILRYRDETAQDGLLSDVFEQCRAELSLHIQALSRMRDTLSPDMGKVIAVLDGDLLRLRGMQLASGYDDYRDAALSYEFAVMRFPKDTDEDEKARVRAPREQAKDCLNRQKELLRRSAAEERAVLGRAGEVLSALAVIVRAYAAMLSEEKRARGILDFADVNHMALALLSDPAVADEYRGQYDYIAVDEYQDSNRVNEAVLELVRRPDNLFFVGDVKQSIYRFRQAEPGLFLEKLERFAAGEGLRVDLTKNFRSAPGVLAAVNDTFSAIMTRQTGEMDYDARARLVPGNPGIPGGAELCLIPRSPDAEGRAEGEDVEDAMDAAVEARFIAMRIKEMMAQDPVGGRNFRYADFAVLLRANTNALVFAQELAAAGVPAYAQATGGYFDAIEVLSAENLLRVIDNRRQDIPLLSALRMPAFGFSAEDLAEIRIRCRAGSLFDALSAAASGGDLLAGKCAAFLDTVAQWRAESRFSSMEALIARIYDETGFYEECGAMPGGAQRQANLDALLTKARAFEASGARGVSRFLDYMDRAASNARVGAATAAEADVVRVLSIHKSKGLEYPVVFLSELGKRMNRRDASERLILHADGGLGLRFIDPATKLLTDTAARRVLSAQKRMEQTAEEMRILYVGMTRAKNRLILTGCVKEPETLLADAPENPTPAETARCLSPIQWLAMGGRASLPAKIYARETFLSAPRAERSDVPLPKADPASLAAIDARFSWEYPFALAARTPAKAAVSRLGHGAAPADASSADDPGSPEQDMPQPVFRAPAFLEGGAESAAARGTGTHAVLQFLPLGAPVSADEAAAFAEKLAERGVLTPAQAKRAYPAAVSWFTHTALYARMRGSARVERELAFALPMPARSLLGGASDEPVLLQGVIDCCFLENGAWTLLDYKTDRIPQGETPETHAERHRAQVTLYAHALARLSGLPVREAALVFLNAKAVVQIPTDG